MTCWSATDAPSSMMLPPLPEPVVARVYVAGPPVFENPLASADSVSFDPVAKLTLPPLDRSSELLVCEAFDPRAAANWPPLCRVTAPFTLRAPVGAVAVPGNTVPPLATVTALPDPGAMIPVPPRVPVLLTLTFPVPVPLPAALVTSKVPALTLVSPEWVLAPASAQVPPPVLVRLVAFPLL